MKVLVTGGRDYADRGRFDLVMNTFDQCRGPITVVIHGAARGADTMASEWAAKRHGEVIERPFPADWVTLGKAAGPIRNQQMLDEAKPDWVVAFPGGNGTADMVRRARKAGVKIVEVPR